MLGTFAFVSILLSAAEGPPLRVEATSL